MAKQHRIAGFSTSQQCAANAIRVGKAVSGDLFTGELDSNQGLSDGMSTVDFTYSQHVTFWLIVAVRCVELPCELGPTRIATNLNESLSLVSIT